MSSCPSLNCTDVLTAPPPLEPNPDVSGIGVIVGFFATAYITLIVLLVHYVLVFDPAEAGLTNETHQANAIDVKVLNFIAKWITRPQIIWGKALEKTVLMISDQQMITGIALVSSAILQLKCGISAYHWQMTIYLVWFSSFTHLATLTFLRGYLHENSPMRWWRLFFMTAIVALLVIALIPTGSGNWLPTDQPAMAGAPALCLFHYQRGRRPIGPVGESFTPMLFSILVLCISYTTRVIKLFELSSKFSRRVLRTMPGNAIKRYLRKLYAGSQSTRSNRWIFSIPYYIILSVFLVVRSWLDLLESMFWEITWLLIALIWGTLRLFATRNFIIDQDKNILAENSWGFGQCLATAMLFLLLFSGIETYIETKRLTKTGRPVLTNLDGTSSSIDADIVEESAVLQPSPTDSRNNSFVTRETSAIEPTTSGDAGITYQAIVAKGKDEQLRRVTRSPTALSLEERSLETLSCRRNPTQRPNSEIELDKFSPATLAAPASTLELQHLSPLERNYYDDQWYTTLAFFNFCQITILSGRILTSAYNIYLPDEFLKNLSSTRSILTLINWIFLFAPLSSFIITMPYVCFTETHINRLKWLHAVRRRLMLARLSYGPGDILLFLIAVSVSFISLNNNFVIFLESILPLGSQTLLIWVYGILGIVYVPWHWIISHKLKREDEI